MWAKLEQCIIFAIFVSNNKCFFLCNRLRTLFAFFSYRILYSNKLLYFCISNDSTVYFFVSASNVFSDNMMPKANK